MLVMGVFLESEKERNNNEKERNNIGNGYENENEIQREINEIICSS